MVVIKHFFTGAALCEFDVETLRQAAEKGKYDLGGADLCGANLGGANLGGANLGGANLGGANLGGANLGDLCEYWKRHRSNGRTPNSIRTALVMLAKEIVVTTMPAPPSNVKVSGLPHTDTD